MFWIGLDFLCVFIMGFYDGVGGRLGFDGLVVEDWCLVLKIFCLGLEFNRIRLMMVMLVMCICFGWVCF